jgi:hypothetical protein
MAGRKVPAIPLPHKAQNQLQEFKRQERAFCGYMTLSLAYQIQPGARRLLGN